MTNQPAGWDGKWANGLDEAIDRLNQQHFEVKPTERNHMDSRDRSAFKYICEQARAFQLLKRLPELIEGTPYYVGISLTALYEGKRWSVETYDMDNDPTYLTPWVDTPELALKVCFEDTPDVK